MTPLDLQIAFQSVSLDLLDILYALLLAATLGSTVALIYHLSVSSRVVSPVLRGTLVVLAMVGAMIMMVIGNNLARAFSLVGALAIIRFRTRLRSPWDISFVFLSLAVGIACGVFAWRVAIVGTLVVGLVVLALSGLPHVGRGESVFLVRVDIEAYEGREGAVAAVLERYTARRSLEEARSLRFGEVLSYRYRVKVLADAAIESFIRELSEIEGVERVVVSTGDEVAEEGD